MIYAAVRWQIWRIAMKYLTFDNNDKIMYYYKLSEYVP